MYDVAWSIRRFSLGALCALVLVPWVLAQEAGAEAEQGTPQTNSVYTAHAADGQRHGLPVEAYAVVPGTRFLVTLENALNTKDLKRNQEFRVRTVEPLEAGRGIFLPSGALIRGHISRVESAGTAGRAKLWLTFDEIHTRFGSLPIVAEVASMPGDHSIASGPVANGVIEGRGSTQKDAMQRRPRRRSSRSR